MFGPSASRPTMPSANGMDAPARRLSTPVALRQPCRSPRVLRTHLHAYACRIYAASDRASFGLWLFGPPHPNASSLIRFLFVRPALCLRLPSDSQSPATPLPLANTSPCRACRGLSPPSECALPGAPKQERPRGALFCLLNTQPAVLSLAEACRRTSGAATASRNACRDSGGGRAS